MGRDRFAEILREYRYTEEEIDILWDSRPRYLTQPSEEIYEERLRKTAKDIAPIKHRLRH